MHWCTSRLVHSDVGNFQALSGTSVSSSAGQPSEGVHPETADRSARPGVAFEAFALHIAEVVAERMWLVAVAPIAVRMRTHAGAQDRAVRGDDVGPHRWLRDRARSFRSIRLGTVAAVLPRIV